MIPYTGSELPVLPIWDDRWPGRARAELDHLAHDAKDSLRIDNGLLARRSLRVEFSWPLKNGASVELEAIYPDSFPRLRPHVRLRGDPTSFPKRHVGPEGELCLLGRDSRLWQSAMTLADLLYSNLEKVLSGGGVEDPQGEPVEVWWNNLASSEDGNFLLIDSEWNVEGHAGGQAEVVYLYDWKGDRPIFQAAISKIWSDDKDPVLIAERSFGLPPQLRNGRTARVKWKRDDDLPLPNVKLLRDTLAETLTRGDRFIAAAHDFSVSIIATKAELQHQSMGDSWVCLFRFKRGSGKKAKVLSTIIPVYRAGTKDIGYRVPSAQVLRDASVALFGLGALGSPLAVDLARNGIKHLSMLDHDVVEPGNSVRWALGASAWGQRKASALAAYIEAEYPWTKVTPQHLHAGLASLNGAASELDIIQGMIAEADVVVDASASTGLTRLLSDLCRAAGKALISVAATASVKGGTVSVYRPTSGCPVCREYAYDDGALQMAPGAEDYDDLLQPPGCAENTFTGASFDLQELSLQAARLVVEVLRERGQEESEVYTLSLEAEGQRVPPRWTTDTLHRSQRCSCR